MGSNAPPKFPQLQLQELKIYLKMGKVGSQCLEPPSFFKRDPDGWQGWLRVPAKCASFWRKKILGFAK